jgi:ketosteroid isomerase-like protein
MASSESVKQLFAQYEKAFSALDFKKIGEFFADTFVSAGPNGVIANSKAEYLKLSQKASEFYRSVGQQSAKILSLSESEISNEYSMVKVHWGVTFQKTGNRLIEFDVSYLIQKTVDPPKIILFIAHQDEAKAMKELGLTENTPK